MITQIRAICVVLLSLLSLVPAALCTLPTRCELELLEVPGKCFQVLACATERPRVSGEQRCDVLSEQAACAAFQRGHVCVTSG